MLKCENLVQPAVFHPQSAFENAPRSPLHFPTKKEVQGEIASHCSFTPVSCLDSGLVSISSVSSGLMGLLGYFNVV